jgi:5-methylcytosine-specific restriction endonuclease McrA
MNVLADKVLVVNRNWQAIHETSVEVALCDIVRGVATAIDTETMQPLQWDDWARLEIRPGDHAIRTVHGPVRVPTVVCKSSYDQMPKRTPKLSKRNRRKAIGERDNKTCQYTGQYAPDGNVDHYAPRSKGGSNAWDNLVWADKKINALKGDLTPEEFAHKTGLKLKKKPKAPPTMSACLLIKPRPDKPDWDLFLMRR